MIFLNPNLPSLPRSINHLHANHSTSRAPTPQVLNPTVTTFPPSTTPDCITTVSPERVFDTLLNHLSIPNTSSYPDTTLSPSISAITTSPPNQNNRNAIIESSTQSKVPGVPPNDLLNLKQPLLTNIQCFPSLTLIHNLVPGSPIITLRALTHVHHLSFMAQLIHLPTVLRLSWPQCLISLPLVLQSLLCSTPSQLLFKIMWEILNLPLICPPRLHLVHI